MTVSKKEERENGKGVEMKEARVAGKKAAPGPRSRQRQRREGYRTRPETASTMTSRGWKIMFGFALSSRKCSAMSKVLMRYFLQP